MRIGDGERVGVTSWCPKLRLVRYEGVSHARRCAGRGMSTCGTPRHGMVLTLAADSLRPFWQRLSGRGTGQWTRLIHLLFRLRLRCRPVTRILSNTVTMQERAAL